MNAKTTGMFLLAGAVIGILACIGAGALLGGESGSDCPSLLSPVAAGLAGAGTDMGAIPEFSTEEQAQQFLITHTDAGQGSSASSTALQQTTTVSSASGGVRTWSFDVDTSTFKPDEYLVKASAVLQDTTGTALFNVLERPAGRSSSAGGGAGGSSGTSPASGSGYFITIDPVGDHYVGDRFTITGTTNIPADSDILVEVYTSSFHPTAKSQSGEFSGASGTVKTSSSSSVPVPAATPAPVTAVPTSADGHRYSTTNVQVREVDEADIVKTNGTYIYAVTGNTLWIIDAYPAEHAKIVATLKFSANPDSLYLYGNRLVVLTEESGTREFWQCEKSRCTDASWWRPRTTILVYNVTDPSRPALVRQVAADGSLSDSRMIDSYLYFVTTSSADSSASGSSFPRILDYAKGSLTPDVYHFDTNDKEFTYSTIGGFDVTGKSAVKAKSFLIGSAGTVYVSPTHLYIGIGSPADDSGAMQTQVYSFTLDQGKIAYAADGTVNGELLSQYSLDENNGTLRLATTGIEGAGKYKGYFSTVYALDSSMQEIGSLKKLAQGDHISAARFVGSRLYLAESQATDSLLAIDLSDPKNMRVLGTLKLPGYAAYLHPYDDNFMLSVGREVNNGGVRIALINVTTVSAPEVTDTIELGGRGSDSEVLRDPKAFLFDAENNLLVLPVHLVGQSGTVAYKKYQPPESAGIWGGAYVFTVTPAQGFHVKGTVEHYDASSGTVSPVKRSLYIDNVLYTLSPDMVVMSDLNNGLSLVNSLEL